MKTKNVSFYLYAFVWLFGVFGSTNIRAQADLTRGVEQDLVLSPQDFYQQIIDYHPIVRQARLLRETAQQELRIARGGFDPKVNSDLNRKEFSNSVYYNLWETKLKVPLWVGEIRGGIEQNNGVFLNPENFVSDGAGIGAVGISIPVGRGLLIDSRRATLKQARFFQDIAEAEQIKEINKVLFAATKDYWEWFFTYYQYQLLDSALTLADQRFRAIKFRIAQGEVAPIDSIKAKVVLQKRQAQVQEANVDLANAKIQVSNYLWGPQDTPLILEDGVNPINRFQSEDGTPNLFELVAFAEENHPEIRKLSAKLQQLDVQERLERNNFLPRIDLSYDILRNVRTKESTRFDIDQNFKVGINFEFPLFLRKERGKLRKVRIKQVQTDFELLQVKREIRNHIQQSYNTLIVLDSLINLQEEIVENYRILRDSEIRKYLNGEGTLFLINTREADLIESQIKLQSQKSKYAKARAELIWASGQPLVNF